MRGVGGARAAAVVLMVASVVGCGGPGRAGSADDSVYSYRLEMSDMPWPERPTPYNAQVRLGDGRRVAMHYRRGDGLVEQHRSAGAKGWSKPQLVYRTRTEACQGVELRTAGGTVGVIADFGVYCSDGEPPTESLAVVGTGSLRDWDVDVTKDFDGWEKIVVGGSGRSVTFSARSSAGRSSVVWSVGGGFGDPRIVF